MILAYGLIGCCWLSPLWLTAAAVCEEPPVQAAPTTQQPAAQDDLAAWALEVRPEIEAIAGAKFTRPVPVKSISTDDLAALLAQPIEAEMAGSLRPSGRPMTQIEIHVHATAAAYKIATRTFGLYHYEDRTIYIVPDTARKNAKHHGWGEDTIQRIPRLAVAHELVHALQDQKTALGERFSRTTGEERAALVSVTEGHAVWVTDQLAAKRGWDGPNAMLWGLVTGAQTDDEPAPKGSAAQPVLRSAPPAELYTLGRAYMKAQAEKTAPGESVTDHLWSIISHPPKTLAEITPAAPSPVAPKPAKP